MGFDIEIKQKAEIRKTAFYSGIWKMCGVNDHILKLFVVIISILTNKHINSYFALIIN